MNPLNSVGKIFIIIGLVFIVIGIIVALNIKIPWIGRLPGDIYIQRKNFSFYFPLTTCLLISAILSFIFILWGKK